MLHFTVSTYNSPIDELLVVTDKDGALRALDFADHRARMQRLLREHYGMCDLRPGPIATAIAEQLDRYFAGDFSALEHLHSATAGTPLQEKIWAGLRTIPAGKTWSYGQLARELGLTDPLAAREVGEVNNANPIAIVTPCHRVVAKNGELKGYAGGIHRKRWLLKHEHALTPDGSRPVVE